MLLILGSSLIILMRYSLTDLFNVSLPREVTILTRTLATRGQLVSWAWWEDAKTLSMKVEGSSLPSFLILSYSIRRTMRGYLSRRMLSILWNISSNSASCRLLLSFNLRAHSGSRRLSKEFHTKGLSCPVPLVASQIHILNWSWNFLTMSRLSSHTTCFGFKWSCALVNLLSKLLFLLDSLEVSELFAVFFLFLIANISVARCSC